MCADSPSNADSLRERRLTRLEQELGDEGIPVPADARARRAVLIEIDYAMRPPVHERQVPSYAACVMPDPACRWSVFGEHPLLVGLDGVEPHFARRFAGGASTLLVVGPAGPQALACFDRDIAREDDLVQLQQDTAGVIVQRTASGHVCVFDDDGIFIWDGVRWQTKPFARFYRDPIVRAAPEADVATLCAILDFAVHYLSAAHVGATIVWYLDDTDVDFMYLWDLEGSLTRKPPPLSAADRVQFPALLSAMRQTDGALLVMPDGRAARLGVQLASRDRTKTLIQPHGGTRHTSARRFSFDNPRSLVLVVSEDGPISVFSDGAVVIGPDAGASGESPEVGLDTGAFRRKVVECPRCEKSLEIEVADDDGEAPSTVVRCRVCDAPVDIEATRARVVGVRKPASPTAAASPNAARLV